MNEEESQRLLEALDGLVGQQRPEGRQDAVNERERQEWQDGEAARQASRAKWADSQAVIEDGDLKHFSGPEITSLANAGRLVHMGIGPRRTRH